MSKPWWRSKTEVPALLAMIGLIIQTVTGDVWFDLKLQGAIVIIYFAIIRFFTKGEITLT